MINRDEYHAAFSAAKQLLLTVCYEKASPANRTNKKIYICHALREAYNTGNLTHEQFWNAQQLVQRRMGTVRILDDFISDRIGIEAFREAMRRSPNAMQDYRHRWLDALIEEFSK